MNQRVREFFLLLTIELILILSISGCSSTSTEWVPTLQPDTGAVIGKVVTSSEVGFHYSAKDLFLGKLISADQENIDPAISFTFGVDPGISIENSDGTFAFTDVLPGIYVLIIWTPENSLILEKPEGGIIKVVVEMDQVTDLGNVTLP
jgi:hypothetical protein